MGCPMFDTPNGMKFLTIFSKLSQTLQQFADLLEGKVKEDQKIGPVWTRRDQLAWELFKLRNGLKMGGTGSARDAMAACYLDVDLFLKNRPML